MEKVAAKDLGFMRSGCFIYQKEDSPNGSISVSIRGQDPTSTADTNPEAAPAVTAIQGASWLEQIGVSISQTSMGQMGGSGSPMFAIRFPERR